MAFEKYYFKKVEKKLSAYAQSEYLNWLCNNYTAEEATNILMKNCWAKNHRPEMMGRFEFLKKAVSLLTQL